MAEPLQLSDVWRRSLDATVQYYAALGEIAVECVETLLSSGSSSLAAVSQPAATEPAPSFRNQPASPNTEPQGSTMVLEAIAGKKAFGVFLLENHFANDVAAGATAGAFLDEQGNEIAPVLEFYPPSVTLRPGEQALIKVSASINEEMIPGTRYRGEIGVPGMMGTRIPVILTRTLLARAETPRSKARPDSNGPRRRIAIRKTSGNSKRRRAKG